MSIKTFSRPYSRRVQNRRTRSIYGPSFKVTPNGGVINDALRSLGIQGDGLTVPDSSYGLWQASTNLVTNGGFETNTTSWAATGSATLSRVTSEQKFGSTSGRISPLAVNDGILANYACAINTLYSCSAWVKVPVGTTIELRFESDVGGFVGGDVSHAGTGNWTRLVVKGTTQATATTVNPIIRYLSGTLADFYVDGIQIEQQPYATPYIETNGATASRTAGYVTAPKRVLSATQGWVAIRFRATYANSVYAVADKTFFSWNDGTTNNEYILYLESTGVSLRFDKNSAGEFQESHVASISWAAGDTITVIAAWTATSIQTSFNGGTFHSSVITTPPANLNQIFSIGFDTSLNFKGMDGEYLWVAAGTGTLSDSDAAAIHAKGNTDDPTNWPSLSAATFFWAADTDGWVTPTLATGANYLDAATITTKTTPTSSDIADFVDAATPSGITSLTAIETTQFVESATISSTTQPSSTEIAQYVDSATISGTTSLSATEVVADVDASTISGVTTPTSTDVADFVDSLSIPTTTTPSSTELHEIPDSGTVSGTTTVITQDLYAAVDQATISSSTTPISIESTDYVDSTSIPGTTSLSSTDVAAFVDSDTITSMTSLTSTDVADYVDSATTITTTELSAVEQYSPAAADSATITSITTLISIETADFVDSSLPSSTTSLSSTDVADDIDASTVSGVTTPISDELHEIPDSNTISGFTTVTTLDVAAYVDLESVSGITTPISFEEAPGDNATVPTSTIPSATDVAAFVDAATISGLTTPAAAEIFGAIDSSIISSSTSITYSDLYGAVDLASITTSTSVASTDIAQDVDSNTVPTGTVPSSADIAAFIESALISSITSLSADETQGRTFTDSNTTTTITSITYTEVAAYDETTSVVITTTSATSTETTDAVDSAIPRSTTVVFSSEIYTPILSDTATITTITYLTEGDVYRFVAVELIGTFRRRWSTSAIESRWTNPVPLLGRKWAAWIH